MLVGLLSACASASGPIHSPSPVDGPGGPSNASADLNTASTEPGQKPAANAVADTPPSAASRAAPAPPVAKAPPPPLPKGTVVLHVGDSMADALGKSLRRELQALGVRNVLEAKEATYIPEWAGFKMKMDQHLAIHNPDLVIITLGGNEVAMPDPTIRADPVRRLVAKVGDRPCLWIAAPLWPGSPNTGILKVIRENCAPCIYVDTNELMVPRMEVLGDGVHPTIAERRRWAKYMIRWLRHNRDPDGARPWDFKDEPEAPPPGSEAWD